MKYSETLANAIIRNDIETISKIVCTDRLIVNSVVYNDGKSVELVGGLRKAKLLARKLCRETNGRVIINHHNPFDVSREYIAVYPGKRLRWYYMHVDALIVKHI